MSERWIAERMRHIESSGIRKVFELARTIKDPVNLSIGQPDFDVPDPIKAAAKDAIDRGANAYTVTQGIPDLRTRLQEAIRKRLPKGDRELIVTSGTSGGVLLALCCTVDPGDEVIVFDPYFVMYPHLITLAGGRPVYVDTYPHFSIDVDRVRQAITRRTKAIILNNPGNPTGVVHGRGVLKDLACLAAERGVLLYSDEIYSAFTYDEPHSSAAEFNENVLVFDGFSKTYGMTGWRLGYAHGPKRVIDEMIKLQQFSYVCAPSMVQHAGAAALDYDVSTIVERYKAKRDRIYHGLRERYELDKPGGAFYAFPKVPSGTGESFVAEAIRRGLLMIPGQVFSCKDSHFRLSYAADDRTLDRGIEILLSLAAEHRSLA